MFKILILAAQNNVADARMEYLIRDRLSWLRFLGFDLGAPTPDANTIRLFREKLTDTGTLQVLFDAFDHRLRINGYLEMGDRSSMRPLLQPPSSAIRKTRRMLSKQARRPRRSGPKSQPRQLKRMLMPGGL